MTLGFSTGCLYKFRSMDESLALYQELGVTAVEIHFNTWSDAQAEDLVRLADELHGFEYVSFHTPKHPYQKDAASQAIVDLVKKVDAIRGLDCVVVHPDPVKDWAIWAESGLKIGVENMDHRKPMGQRAADLRPIFEKYPQFGLVLDVNHIYTNDRTMALVDEFYAEFGDRLLEYHVSGFTDLHEALYMTDQPEIVRAIKRPEIPMIVESELPDDDGVTKERDYILKYLPLA